MQIQTTDKAVLCIEYLAPAEPSKRFQTVMSKGELTSFEDQNIRSVWTIESGNPQYSWVNRSLFVGEARFCSDPQGTAAFPSIVCTGLLEGLAGMAETTEMRKDAEENRERLIAVASEAMRNEGSNLPFEAIAERAGVSRPALYRNFTDLQAMYEAVLRQDLDRLAENIEADAGKDALALLRHTAEMMRAYDKFLSRLIEMPDYRAKENQGRMAAILADPLAEAQGCGTLHQDLTAGDVLIACLMLGSHWNSTGRLSSTKSSKGGLPC